MSGEEVNESNLAVNLAVDFYYNRKKEIINAVNPDIYIGFTDWQNVKRGYSCYITGIEVFEGAFVPKDMTTYIVPSSKYAVFRYIGLFHPSHLYVNHISDLWGYVFL